jgi:hypothetical protein
MEPHSEHEFEVYPGRKAASGWELPFQLIPESSYAVHRCGACPRLRG